LVVYFAIGTIGGALDSICGDIVNLAQVLPTYWTPNVIRDLSEFRPKSAGHFDFEISAIEIENLTYSAAGIDGPFSKPITLHIPCRQSVAVVGPSGSGKSTLLRLLLGNLKASGGLIRLVDKEGMVIRRPLSDCGTLVLAQDLRLFGSRLREVVDPQRMHSDQELEEAAEALQLNEVLESLPLRWKTPVNEYSRDLSLGQLQLFKISRVLLRPYSIVISDEPTCHLPEELHLKALATISQNCSLHLSAIHRSSGFAQFDSFLVIQPDGSITVQAEQPA
jgi:ABC-type multidrug transport system fused ATPase/permease subunit